LDVQATLEAVNSQTVKLRESQVFLLLATAPVSAYKVSPLDLLTTNNTNTTPNLNT
jgi:hypothetical protein